MEHAQSGITEQIALIGCEVLHPELAAHSASCGLIAKQQLLTEGLDETPSFLRTLLAQAIASAEEDPNIKTIVLAYGLCGTALDGLAPSRCQLGIAAPFTLNLAGMNLLQSFLP